MAATIPWQKIKEKALELSGELWDSQEKELRRIMEKLPTDEREVVVSFQHVIDCSGDAPAIKTKISLSERFTESLSGSVDDPAQLELGEKA